jgi:hypothetical protein
MRVWRGHDNESRAVQRPGGLLPQTRDLRLHGGLQCQSGDYLRLRPHATFNHTGRSVLQRRETRVREQLRAGGWDSATRLCVDGLVRAVQKRRMSVVHVLPVWMLRRRLQRSRFHAVSCSGWAFLDRDHRPMRRERATRSMHELAKFWASRQDRSACWVPRQRQCVAHKHERRRR